jgi:hypothetical protein
VAGKVGEAEARAERIAAQAEAAYEERVALGRERGRELIAEAELKRAEVLRQLARTRQRAQLNLEQLRVGRERLLTAYEVARATIDQATGELDVALPEAKALAERLTARIGDDAARSLQELEAEFELERLDDLRILADDDPGARVPPRPRAEGVAAPEGEVEVEIEGVEPVPGSAPPPKVFDREAAEAEADAEAVVTGPGPTPVTDGSEDEVIDLTHASATEVDEPAEDPAPTVP